MSKEYTADTIAIHSGLDHIRKRPTMHIGSREADGQAHMISELIANSVDELMLKPDGGTVYMLLFRDNINNRYQFAVIDNGRGIPADRLKDVLTIQGASGKMDNSAYFGAAGQNGMGAKVSVALSTRFRAITKNAYDGGLAASISFADSKVIVEPRKIEANIPVGTVIVLEPDLAQFFTNGEEFMNSEYMILTAACKKINIFNEQINFQFYIYDRPLPEAFWDADIEDAVRILYDSINDNSKQIEYATDQVVDKSSYLLEMWKVNSDIVYRDRIVKVTSTPGDKLSYDLRVFFTRNNAAANSLYLVSLNNVILSKNDNSIVITFMKALREAVASKLEHKELAQFVLENYRFPSLLLAAGVIYEGTEFRGTTKDSFKNSVFEQEFHEHLTMYFNEHPDNVSKMIAVLLTNIQNAYNNYYSVPIKKTDINRTFLNLESKNRYKECKSEDRSKCELFIVEGASASVVRARNNEFQAVYETRGKPLNAMLGSKSIHECRRKLAQDPIYRDLMQILNVNSATTDISQCRFGKIIIATDADADGHHIRALHINNLYFINPLLIESGLVWLANPPLYSMDVSTTGKLHLRDKVALYDARIQYIYTPALEIKLQTPTGIVELDDALLRDYCYYVHYVGQAFDRVANQLAIPILLLERLVSLLKYLYPRVLYSNLEEAFAESIKDDPNCSVKVDPLLRTMIVSLGDNDYSIALAEVGYIITTQLLSKLKKYDYFSASPIVRTKFKGSIYTTPTLISTMMLYDIFCKLDGVFPVSRYKGLGELDDQDCIDSIMNPATRSLTQITDVGIVETNMRLLDKKDSTLRKQLLDSSSVLSASFVRNQRN